MQLTTSDDKKFIINCLRMRRVIVKNRKFITNLGDRKTITVNIERKIKTVSENDRP